MQATPTDLPEVLILEPRRFGDARGFFSETYNQRVFEAAGVDARFVQDNHSYSAAIGVVRGLHAQEPPVAQAKLVRVAQGRVLDVAVDARVGSPRYGRHVCVELSGENGRQLFVPEGFLHGFMVLDPHTHVLYKTTDYYAPDAEHAVSWRDPDLGIDWPMDAAQATLSAKDAAAGRFADFRSPFRYEEG